MKLCIDAGGTYFRYSIENRTRQMASGSDQHNGKGFIAWIEGLLEKYPEIKTILIAFAGQVKDGVILNAPNLEVEQMHIKDYFTQKYSVEFFIQNDLSCAVLAEANYFKTKEICALYVGSGLGLGVITNGSLLVGYNAQAAEIGHIPYKKAPFMCGCGKNNCIELFGAGAGLRKFKNYLQLDLVLTTQELRDSKDEKEQGLYKEFEEALFHAIGIVITLFNPEVLVLGGGIIQNDATLFERILTHYQEFTMPQSTQGLKIVKTELENAVLRGASILKESL